jgi:phosphatidylinositol alpha-1,6-mannosyltransferase
MTSDVVVYTASMPDSDLYDASLSFPVYRDPSRLLLPTPAVARRISEVMRRHGCDRIVFGASVPLGLLAPALRRAGARRIVALTHGHEVWWSRLPATRAILRRVGDTVDVMTYVSEWCRTHIEPALSPQARARMSRLSPGVDPARFFPGCGGAEIRQRLAIDADAPVVVCLGRLVRRKGQDTLIESWPAVLRRYPSAILLLVGTGPDESRLRRMADKADLGSSIVFAGLVSEPEVPAYLDAGDVFAMPCRTRRLGLEVEAWGIVFLEAQACGLPVVIGASGGAPETLSSQRGGRVVVGTAACVEEALLHVLSEPAKGRVEPGVAPTTHTWDTVSHELRRLLH